MKKVLYVTNIAAPYRERFFAEFSKDCDLTVLYERQKSTNRDESWAEGRETGYKKEYLQGITIGNENSFSLKILKYVFGKYDSVILGCYNSPVQMFAILLMRLLRRPYILSTDGEIFIGQGLKAKFKKYFLRGARRYLAAGEKAAESLGKIVPPEKIETYYFSSLNEKEVSDNAQAGNQKRNGTVLVIGQYFDYKGMDIAAQAAKMDPSIPYRFVGTGKRTDLFVQEQQLEGQPNVEVIPFMDKETLAKEYRACAMLVLPSRQECWGLVINEAASYGTPIVSTWGSGAAVEFLADHYPQYLAEPGNAKDLLEKIVALTRDSKKDDYGQYLKNISTNYTIERCVEAHKRIYEISEPAKQNIR